MTASGPISLSDWQGGFTDEFVTALPCPGTHDSCATGPFDLKGSIYPDWIKAVTGVGSAWFGGLVGLFVGLSASALADKIIEDVSQTQTLHIPAQLACGYRAFDLRVGYWPTKKGDASGRSHDLFMCHGMRRALRSCADAGHRGADLREGHQELPAAGLLYTFLKAHPTEHLFVSIRYDMTDASRKDAAAALGMDLANDLQNRFKPRKEMWHWSDWTDLPGPPKKSEVAGKIILLRRYTYDTNPVGDHKIGVDLTPGTDWPPPDSEPNVAFPEGSASPTFYVCRAGRGFSKVSSSVKKAAEDIFSTITPSLDSWRKSKHPENLCLIGLTGAITDQHTFWVTSPKGGEIKTPKAYARELNPMLRTYLGDTTKGAQGKKLGLIWVDYADEAMAKAIIFAYEGIPATLPTGV